MRRSLHPLLVPFPLAFFGMSFVFDLLSLKLGAPMVEAARYNVVGGLVASALTVAAGVHDYFTQLLAGGRRLARWHALVNLVAVALFAFGLGDRWAARGSMVTPLRPLVLSAIAVVLLGASAYLGGIVVLNFARRPTQPH